MKKFCLLVIFITFNVLVFAQIKEIGIDVESSSVCEGDSVHLVLTITTTVPNDFPEMQIKWSPNLTLSSDTIFSPMAYPSVTTAYTVVVTDMDNNISLTDSVTITVVAQPLIAVSLIDEEDSIFCSNYPVEFEVTQENVSTIDWTHNGIGAIKFIDSEHAIYIPGEDEQGEVTVAVAGENTCGTAFDTITISFVEETKATIVTTDSVLCSGNTISFEGTGQNYNSFQWSTDGAGTLNDAQTLTPTYVSGADESGTVNVVFAALGDQCDSYDTLSFVVVPMPEIQLPADDTVCENAQVEVMPDVYENISAVKWEHDGSGSFIYASDSSSVTYVPSENELETVNIIVVASNSGYCNVTDTMNVLFVEEATASVEINDTLLCSNESLELQGTAENYVSYEWSHNGAGVLSNTSSLTPTYTPVEDELGIVQVILHVYGVANEIADTASVVVSSIYLGDVDNVVVCKGDSAVLSVYSSLNYSYLWSTGDTTNEISVEATISTSYSVDVTNTDNCTADAEIYVDVADSPVISLSADTENKILYVSPADLAKYEFYDQDGNLLSTGSDNYYDYTSASSSVEMIYVIAYNDYGCSNENSESDDSNKYEIPQLVKIDAFSPNGDGVNDVLLSGRKIKVIDRSSKILYDGWDGWDGTYDGKEMPKGTYFYLLYDGNDVYYKSAVTLIR